MGGDAVSASRQNCERVDLSKRDHALFLGLFEAGVMLRSQIADLYFEGSYEAASKRLQKLLKHGYLRERSASDRQGAYLPAWISLAEPAFCALKKDGLVEDDFTWERHKRRLTRASSSLAHDLQVVDLWVAFAKAGRVECPHTVKHFSTWPYRFQFETTGLARGAPSLLFPDAFAVITFLDDPALPPIESAIFFEWDRSTESRTILRGKATGYDEFYRSGAFAERCGGKHEQVEDYPFRTVFAVRNEERRNNLLEELARPSHTGALIHDQFWATTWDEILRDPFGAIYLHVGDYSAATAGTMYDAARFVTNQRTRDRDELMRERAVKRRLVE